MARRLEQRGTWRFVCKQALEVHLFMSRMGRLAKHHNFFNKGLHGCGVDMYVALWERGCELLMDAFYASTVLYLKSIFRSQRRLFLVCLGY